MNKPLLYCLLLISALPSFAQNKLEWDGQVSAFGNYSPDSNLEVLLGGRYIPELNYGIALDSGKSLDFEASANLYGSTSFHPFSQATSDGAIDPYRIWARYSSDHFELRLGLQKIDFGAATMLRPLQWFNQIDPRDPLQLTNGVYGALGRYYFSNNANIWLWTLVGNDKTRGFDAVKTYDSHPEFGGRIQYPIPRGETAASYHHRTADARNIITEESYQKTPEDRFGIDAKWDIEVGFWVEASYTRKSKNIGLLTHQTLLNIGMDYTFAIGSGLNVVTEHLITAYSEDKIGLNNNANITAATLSYPLGMFDNLSTVLYHNWPTDDFTLFLNYQHQFPKITGYVMAYYNPATQQGVQENELINNASGPGIRFMLVYNH